jgi:competence protein ComEC
MAVDYELRAAAFCVTGNLGERLSIRVTGGEIPSGSLGLLSDPEGLLRQGDCVDAILQLSIAEPWTRFAFKAKLKSLVSPVRGQPELQPILKVREYLSTLEGDSKNLVAGLAVGLDSGLTPEFVENMRTTGLTHLTAVSGANCAIVLGMVWLLLKRARLGRGVRTIASLFALAGYVLLVGWQPSVLRSAFMMSLVLIALEFGRRIWLPAALLLGSAVLLIVDPWLITEYGFWLSVLATFGLVTLTPKLVTQLENYVPKWLAIGLAATLAAQLWCLPILIQLQGGITTHSVLANLLAEPAVPVITVLGLIAALVGPVVPFLGGVLLELAAFASNWLVFVANSLSRAPQSLLPVPEGVLGIALTGFFVVSISIAMLRKVFAMYVTAAFIGVIWLGTLVSHFSGQNSFSSFNWSVVACDVGQGDALVIRSSSEIAVIDVGKDDRLIDSCLDRLGVKHIDLLVITHFDFDHVGGLPGALRGRTVEKSLVSAFTDERPQAEGMLSMLRSNSGSVDVGLVGSSGWIGDYSWRVFSALGNAASDANQASLGLRFESSYSVIYTLGDLDEYAQEVSSPKVFPSEKLTIVKVSHHGSADQSDEFYQRIQADVALISVGEGNSYGHPTKKALELLEASGSKIFRTDESGAIAVSVGEQGLEVKLEKDR